MAQSNGDLSKEVLVKMSDPDQSKIKFPGWEKRVEQHLLEWLEAYLRVLDTCILTAEQLATRTTCFQLRSLLSTSPLSKPWEEQTQKGTQEGLRPFHTVEEQMKMRIGENPGD